MIKYYESEEEMDDDFEKIMDKMQNESDELEEENRVANKENIGKLRWSIDIECPKCGVDTDLSEIDQDGIYSTPIFNNRWDDLKGEEVECSECEYVFKIHEIIY